MEDFNNYDYADVSDEVKKELTQLENKILKDEKKNVVLIAYEEKK